MADRLSSGGAYRRQMGGPSRCAGQSYTAHSACSKMIEVICTGNTLRRGLVSLTYAFLLYAFVLE